MVSKYEESGVSIDAQDKAIQGIKAAVGETETERVLSNLGSFGGLFDAAFPRMEHPVLVASTDGVGTKLKVAIDAGIHDTVGQCLVNHCINDILVQGAQPLFFMDYVATGKLEPGIVGAVVTGMAKACRDAGVALLGGEMAEMPGFYGSGDYDVAGFIVGVVDKPKILGSDRVKPGQTLIGLASTGLHTNGYSLARKILFQDQGLGINDRLPGANQTIAELLLAIHAPYFKQLEGLLGQNKIAAMAHITGGGFLDNIPRVLPQGVGAEIELGSYPVPSLFRFLVEKGEVSREESYRVFNMGIGMVLIVEPRESDAVMQALADHGTKAWVIGKTLAGERVVSLREA